MRTLIQMIKTSDIANILEEYREVVTKDCIDKFNVFTITSDFYHRENYHSDILAAFLRHKEDKTGKYILLEAFIEMLNASKKQSGKQIDYYSKPVIEREEHRIDILIKDEDTKHCIIIENKINDAADMYRQLPRYYDIMKDAKDYQVDAIVYLTLLPDKLPDRIGWKKDDCQKIESCLIPIPVANTKNEISLLKNWVEPCFNNVYDEEVKYTLSQYKRLLEKLSNSMSKLEKAKELNHLILDGSENKSLLKDMLSLREMMNLLPEAMADDLKGAVADEIKELLSKEDTSLELTKWQPNSCVINLGDQNTIFVYCEFSDKSAYKVGVADFTKEARLPSWMITPHAQENLQGFTDKKKSSDRNDGVVYEFGYYEKDKVLGFIKRVILIYQK